MKDSTNLINQLNEEIRPGLIVIGAAVTTLDSPCPPVVGLATSIASSLNDIRCRLDEIIWEHGKEELADRGKFSDSGEVLHGRHREIKKATK